MPPAAKKVVSHSTPQARRKKANIKAVALEKKAEARNKVLAAQLDSWFLMFDTDGDKQFNRDELTALLSHLNPGAPPTAEVINLVMRDATGVYGRGLEKGSTDRVSGVYDKTGQRIILSGHDNGLVHRDKLVPVVKKYSAYIKEQAKIDAVFAKFDTDESGTLEREELLPLMKLLSPDVEPDEEDVNFIFAQVDGDGNGCISRSELLPLLAVWKQLAEQKAPATTSGERSTPRALEEEEESFKSEGGVGSFSPEKGGVSLLLPTGANSVAARAQAAASEPKTPRSSACVVL